MNKYSRHYKLDKIRSVAFILFCIIIPTVILYTDLAGYFLIFLSTLTFIFLIIVGVGTISRSIYNVTEYDKHHKDIE
jgi:hypothetical protein